MYQLGEPHRSSFSKILKLKINTLRQDYIRYVLSGSNIFKLVESSKFNLIFKIRIKPCKHILENSLCTMPNMTKD